MTVDERCEGAFSLGSLLSEGIPCHSCVCACVCVKKGVCMLESAWRKQSKLQPSMVFGHSISAERPLGGQLDLGLAVRLLQLLLLALVPVDVHFLDHLQELLSHIPLIAHLTEVIRAI